MPTLVLLHSNARCAVKDPLTRCAGIYVMNWLRVLTGWGVVDPNGTTVYLKAVHSFDSSSPSRGSRCEGDEAKFAATACVMVDDNLCIGDVAVAPIESRAERFICC